MPAPLAIPLIAAGASIIGSGANAYAQGKMNKRTLQYNRETYDKSRRDNLADWAMQNEYNSPTAQMARFRDAGLNPNLVYGQSNEGAVVRSADQQAWNPRAPEFNPDIQSSLMSIYDIKLKEAQTDNLRTQNTVQVQEAALKAAQTAATATNNARSQFDLEQAQSLKETSLETAKANLRGMEQNQAIQLRQDERNAAITASNIKEAAERILKLRLEQANTEEEKKRIQASIKDLEKNIELKELDINLRKQGINPNDPMWMRILGQFMKDLPERAQKALDAGKVIFKNPFGAFKKF